MSYEHRYESQRLQNYGCMKFKMVWTLRGTFFSLCAHTPCFSSNSMHRNLWIVRSGDHIGHICGTPRPIHRSGICLLRHSVACPLKHGVSRHAGSASVIVFCVVHIRFNFKPYHGNRLELDSFIWHFWLGMTSGIRSWSTDVKLMHSVFSLRSSSVVKRTQETAADQHFVFKYPEGRGNRVLHPYRHFRYKCRPV